MNEARRREPRREDRARRLGLVQREMDGCQACPDMIGPVVHGPPVVSPVFLLGQAPGRAGALYLSLVKSIVAFQMSVTSKMPTAQLSSFARFPEYQVVRTVFASIGATPA
jgi:hypothetical protein